ncbi:MAG TPA: hypothetical protein VF828_01115 [Patescibacteria group bacterium]
MLKETTRHSTWQLLTDRMLQSAATSEDLQLAYIIADSEMAHVLTGSRLSQLFHPIDIPELPSRRPSKSEKPETGFSAYPIIKAVPEDLEVITPSHDMIIRFVDLMGAKKLPEIGEIVTTDIAGVQLRRHADLVPGTGISYESVELIVQNDHLPDLLTRKKWTCPKSFFGGSLKMF